MQRQKKKITKFGKIAMATFLAGAITYNHIKSVLLGPNSDSKRRALFYFAIGSIFVYNSCGDKLERAFNMTYNKADQFFKDRNNKKIEYLENKLMQNETYIEHVKDSLNSKLLEQNNYEIESLNETNYQTIQEQDEFIIRKKSVLNQSSNKDSEPSSHLESTEKKYYVNPNSRKIPAKNEMKNKYMTLTGER